MYIPPKSLSFKRLRILRWLFQEGADPELFAGMTPEEHERLLNVLDAYLGYVYAERYTDVSKYDTWGYAETKYKA